MAVVHDADSEDQDAAEQLTRDGVRPVLAREPLDVRGLRSLLSSARHELGSPLQSIQGFAELLAAESFGGLSTQQHSFVAHILEAGGELRCAMDACFELAQLELVGHAPTFERVDLLTTLSAALAEAQARTGITSSAPASAKPTLVQLDRELFGRAVETLLIGLSARDTKSFVVAIDGDSEYALVSLAHTARQPRGEVLPLPELAARDRTTRNLLWFRLASALFAAQDASLALSEALDYAEVRIHLRPTH